MKIGMVGGVGPESTVDYYQQIIKLYREKTGDGNYPEIIINSINMSAMLECVSKRDFKAIVDMLTSAINLLYKASCGLAFIACNTPHIVFKEIEQASPIPLVSIVESARKEADRLNMKRAGLLGTRFTMQNSFYQAEFDKSGIEVVVPNDKEQLYIEHKLFSEIEQGVFLEETRNGLLLIAERLIKDESIDGVILGCTELPLILTEDSYRGVSFLNTTKIHVNNVVDKYFELING